VRLDPVLEEPRPVENEADDEDNADGSARASVSAAAAGEQPGIAVSAKWTTDGQVATERHSDRDPRTRQDEDVDDRRAVRLQVPVLF